MTSDKILAIATMFLVPLLAVLIPILIGQRYGHYRKKKSEDVQHAPVGAVVGAAFGLLAFMLAITFQIAANRYDARKQLLLEEVTNIRTAYLRAGLIPEPYRNNTKKLLVEYVDLRVDLATDLSKLNIALSRSQEILDSLWKYTEALAEQDRSSEVYALYTTSVNDIVDAYNQRIAVGLQYRIPGAVLFVLFIISFFSMLVLGYQFGISGKGNFGIILLLSFIFAIVMFLILALDQPEKGLAIINQKPMITLQQQLHDKQLNVR
jgi:ABC-type multidrug transport system fused ATPase/permease subunit